MPLEKTAACAAGRKLRLVKFDRTEMAQTILEFPTLPAETGLMHAIPPRMVDVSRLRPEPRDQRLRSLLR